MKRVDSKPKRLSYDELHPFAKYKWGALSLIVDPEGVLRKKAKLIANDPRASQEQKSLMRRLRRPAYDSLPAVKTLRSGAPAEVLEPPRIEYKCTPIAVGDPKLYPGTIYSVTYDGLLMNCIHHRLPNGSWSGGGPLYIFKRHQQHLGMRSLHYFRNGVDLHTTIGGVSPCPMGKWGTDMVPGYQPWSVERAKAAQHYAHGYARARPGNPVASAAQFLYELRQDGIPYLPGSRIGAPYARHIDQHLDNFKSTPKALLSAVGNALHDHKMIGDEYLNYAFGWRPLVNDIRKMYNLWKTVDRRLAQLIKNNGRWQRRHATLVDESNTTQDSRWYPWPFANVQGAPPNWMDGMSVWKCSTRTTEKVWFSGAFYYYTPDIGSSQWTRRAKATLFGALPTPEAVWSVVPWSWLIDWFSNVGDLMSNISPNAVDNAMLGHSHIMRHYVQETTYTVETSHTGIHTSDGHLGADWDGFGGTFTSIDKIETKVRAGGCNPFGLDTSFSDLSTGQVGILAALGASRSRVRPSI